MRERRIPADARAPRGPGAARRRISAERITFWPGPHHPGPRPCRRRGCHRGPLRTGRTNVVCGSTRPRILPPACRAIPTALSAGELHRPRHPAAQGSSASHQAKAKVSACHVAAGSSSAKTGSREIRQGVVGIVQAVKMDCVIVNESLPCCSPGLRRRPESWRPSGLAQAERLPTCSSELHQIRKREFLRYYQHVVEILSPAVLLLAVAARVGVKLLSELLLRADGWHYHGRDISEVEQIPKLYFLDRARVFRDDVDVDTKVLEYPAGEPGRDRISKATFRTFPLNSPALPDQELKMITEVQRAGAVKHIE